MDNNQINFTFRNTKEDMVEFMYFNTLIKKRWVRPFFIILFVFGVIMAVLGFILGMDNTKFYLCDVFLMVAPLFLIAFIKLFGTITYNNMKNLIVDNTVHMGDSEIESESNLGTSKYSYDMIFTVYESKKCLFIYINKITAIVLNKNTLGTEHIKQIKELLKEKVEADKLNIKEF